MDVRCCAPRRAAGTTAVEAPGRRGGTPQWGFLMGDAFDEGYPEDGETPVHHVRLSPFRLDATTVTNAQFAAFVDATGHVTDAERFDCSAVFHLLVDRDADVIGAVAATPWWLSVRGAAWHAPEGGRSTVAGREDHPAVHISWNDAVAYARWAGKRLPTEAEWEYAARGGLAGKRYPRGDELGVCNVFTGGFPSRPAGHVGTLPAAGDEPNGFGLHHAAGNVWEWCTDRFSATYYAESPVDDPPGPAHGEERIIRGGSYLCHPSYCHRYRVAARTGNTPDSSAGNIGFRCANDCAPGATNSP